MFGDFSFLVVFSLQLSIGNAFTASGDNGAAPKSFTRRERPLSFNKRSWTCVESRCRKHIFLGETDNSEDKGSVTYSSADSCKSVCGPQGSLWPAPTEVFLSKTLREFNVENMAVKLDIEHFTEEEGVEDLELMLSDLWVTFAQSLRDMAQKLTEIGPPSRPSSNIAKLVETGGLAEPPGSSGQTRITVKIRVDQDAGLDMYLSTERESYELNIVEESFSKDVVVSVEARSYFGARHAIETLTQLVTYDPDAGVFQITSEARIKDKPSFPYRGLMLDTSRNYYSLASIKRLIDGMARNKMNVFHWHITDTQSFPFVSKRVPEMANYGSYSKSQVYYPDEIQELAVYARSKGVFVLPELDAPSHAGYGWQWGHHADLGNLTCCLFDKWITADGSRLAAEPPSGQLNPLNDNVYKVLGSIYQDMIEAFYPASIVPNAKKKKKHFRGSVRQNTGPTLPMFHMGGDEVSFECWKEDPAIEEWMKMNSYAVNPHESPTGYLALWHQFQEKALEHLQKANQRRGRGKGFKDGVIMWSSDLVKSTFIGKYLDPTKYVIQVWTNSWDSLLGDLLQRRYRIVLSNSDSWYLDCGFDAWIYDGQSAENNWCSPYKGNGLPKSKLNIRLITVHWDMFPGWKTMYMNSPTDIISKLGLEWETYRDQVLGGEGAMWSEQADEFSAEMKVWPRTCAIAERLWSDPQDSTWRDAEPRILQQRRRMAVFYGLYADAIQPEFCRQNDGQCYVESKEPQWYFPAEQQFPAPQEHPAIPGHERIVAGWKTSRRPVVSEDILRWVAFTTFVFVLILVKRRFFCTIVLGIYHGVEAFCRQCFFGDGIRMIRIQ